MRVAVLLTCCVLVACAKPAPAEPAFNARQAVLDWVASLPAETGEIDAPTFQRVFRMPMKMESVSKWKGERAFGTGSVTATVERLSDGPSGRLTLPKNDDGSCVVTAKDLVASARNHGYEVTFNGVPGRPYFWSMGASTARSRIGLMAYGSPNMTEETKETACVGVIYSHKGLPNE